MLPDMAEPLENLQINFYDYISSSSDGLVVGVMDHGVFIPVDTAVLIPNRYNRVNVMFNNYHGTSRTIALRNFGTDGTENSTHCIDNIVVDFLPGCMPVADVYTTFASGDSLGIAWTPTGTENAWEVVVAGDTHTIDTNYFLATGLSPSTHYTFTIRAICTTADTSPAVEYTTRTACGKLTTLPYKQDFEHEALTTNADTSFVPCWHHRSNVMAGFPEVISGNNHTLGGHKSLQWHATSGNYHIAVLPEIDTTVLPDNALTLSFWTRRSDIYSTPVFYVGVMSNPDSAESFVIYDTIASDGSYNWTHHTSVLRNWAGIGTHIAIRDNSATWNGVIDDIVLDMVPTCPTVENVTPLVTPVAAIVTWTPHDDTSYIGALVEYKATDASTWYTQTVYGVTYAILTGLAPGTLYNLRVAALCEGSEGAAVNSMFSTPNLPCTETDTSDVVTTTIGTGTNQIYGVPVHSMYGSSLCQSIYLASELATLGTGTTINTVTYTWSNNGSYDKEFSIYMTNTTKSVFESASPANHIAIGPAFLVYSGPHPIGTSGSVTYQLDTPFEWDGTSNICITTTMNRTNEGSPFHTGFRGFSTQTDPLAYRTLYCYQDYIPFNGVNWASDGNTERSIYRPNITLTAGTCQQYDTCAYPAAIVTDVTTNSVSIVWVPGYTETECTLAYRLVGDSVFTIAATGVTSNSYTFTGLNPANDYEFLVTNNCGNGRSTMLSATTLCAAISSLPFSEDFNNWGSGYNAVTGTYAMPSCWHSIGNAYIYTNYGMSDTLRGIMRMPIRQNASSIIVLPELDTTVYHANQTQVTFYTLYSSVNSGHPMFAVGVMTDPSDANTFVAVDTVQHTGDLDVWQALEVPLAAYSGNGTYVAVRTVYNDSVDGSYYLDDLTLEQIPTCPHPDSLYATGATTSSVVVGWRDRAGASQWQVEYGPEGFEPGTGTLVNASSNPFTLTGLPSSYRGEYYVRAICDSGDIGPLSRQACLFNTRQVPATVPYSYGFEESAEWANWESISSYSTNWFRGIAVSNSGNYSMYVSADSGATYKPYYYNRNVSAATYRDIDFGNTDSSFILTFRSRAGTAPSYDIGGELLSREGLFVLLVDNNITPVINNSSTSPWGNIESLNCLATVRRDTNWITYEVCIDNISGIHRLAFFWHNGRWGGSPNMLYEPAAVDNLQIYLATCPRPLGLDTIIVTGNTATLTWNDDSTANYQVDYCYAGGIRQTVNATTNSIILTGLSPTSVYQAWVRKICAPGDTSRWSDPIEFKTKICDGGFAVGLGDSNSADGTSCFAPVSNLHKYSVSETIIDSNEIGGSMDITAIAYYFDFDYIPMTWKTDVDIWLQPTYKTRFNSNNDMVVLDSSVAVRVYHGALNCVYGWNYFNFDTVFNYNGQGNLLVVVDDNGSESHGSGIDFGTLSCDNYKTLVLGDFYSDIDPTSTAPFTGEATRYMWRPIMQLVSCTGGCLPPAVSSIATDYQNATITVTGQGSLFELSYGLSISSQPNVLTSTTGVFNLGGLTPGTTYYYSVRQDCGNGDYSSYNQGIFATQDIECFPIRNFSIDSTYYDGATFSWSAGGNETAWEVMVNNYVTSITDTVTDTTYTIRGLYSNTQYNVNVRPLCGPNADIAGDWMDSSVLFTTDICQPVSNINYVGRTGTSITLAWDAAAGTDTWRVAYGYPGFSHGEELGTYTTTDNPFMLTGLDTATAYTVQVATLCTEELVSSWSQYDFTTTDGESIVSVDAEGNIAIFPNPASTKVTLRVGEQWVGSTVSIIDVNGREVASFRVHNSQFDIDLSTLRAGAYFVRITGEQATTVRKLIMQ